MSNNSSTTGRLLRIAAVLGLAALAFWALSGDGDPPEPEPSQAPTRYIDDDSQEPEPEPVDPLGWGVEEAGRAWSGPPTARNPDLATLHAPDRPPDHELDGCYRYWATEGVIEKVVVAGDSLGKWSAWFTSEVADLAEWNGFGPDVQLLEGDRLLVSTGPTPVVHRKVAAGESFSGLLKQYALPNHWYVRAWNCIGSNRQLQAGADVLILPARP